MDGFDFDNRNIQDFDGCVFIYNDIHYITLREFESDDVQYPTAGIIAHEAKHLVNNVFIDIGQRLDEHNDEVECYLLGWFVDIIHELLNTHK